MRISFDLEEAEEIGNSLNMFFELEKELDVHTFEDHFADGHYIVNLAIKDVHQGDWFGDMLGVYLQEWRMTEEIPSFCAELHWYEVSKVWMIEVNLPVHDDPE